MKNPFLNLFAFAFLVIYGLSACNMPAAQPGATQAPGLVQTLAALTWVAMQAQQVPSATPTPAPPNDTPLPRVDLPTSTRTSTPTTTPVPSFTPLVTPTNSPPPTQSNLSTPDPNATSAPCNAAQFVKDVTIPDETVIPAAVTFTKIWRIKNTGSCAWDKKYSMVFVSGDRMAGNDTFLNRTVNPSQTVDIAISLSSPKNPGSYRGNWKLSNGRQVFGGGPKGEQDFWVIIKVAPNPQGMVYSFTLNYCAARWESSVGVLPCPGQLNSGDGFVTLLDEPLLETGKENESVLWTQTQAANGGWITGIFPPFAIQAGDRFLSDIGCLEAYPRCNVFFELFYQIGNDSPVKLGSWNEVNNKHMSRIDVGLTQLTGKTVSLILKVVANKSPEQSAAFWLQPQIRRH